MNLSTRKQTGKALQRLISSLVETHPGMRVGQAGMHHHTRRMESGNNSKIDESGNKSKIEECIGLLDTLKMGVGQEDLLSKMGRLSVKPGTKNEKEEDLSFWEDLGAWNGDDLQGPITEDLEDAESRLMEEYKKVENAHKRDIEDSLERVDLDNPDEEKNEYMFKDSVTHENFDEQLSKIHPRGAKGRFFQ